MFFVCLAVTRNDDAWKRNTICCVCVCSILPACIFLQLGIGVSSSTWLGVVWNFKLGTVLPNPKVNDHLTLSITIASWYPIIGHSHMNWTCNDISILFLPGLFWFDGTPMRFMECRTWHWRFLNFRGLKRWLDLNMHYCIIDIRWYSLIFLWCSLMLIDVTKHLQWSSKTIQSNMLGVIIQCHRWGQRLCVTSLFAHYEDCILCQCFCTSFKN